MQFLQFCCWCSIIMKFIEVFTATNWTKQQKMQNTEQKRVHENLLQVWGFYIDLMKTSHSFRFIRVSDLNKQQLWLDLIRTTETWQLEFWSDWSPPPCESVFSYSFLLSCGGVRVLQPADFNHTQRFTTVFLANCLFAFLNHRLHSLLLSFPKSELHWDRKLLGFSTSSKTKNHKRRMNNTETPGGSVLFWCDGRLIITDPTLRLQTEDPLTDKLWLTVFTSELTGRLHEYQQIFRKLSRKWFIRFDLSNATWTCTDRGEGFKIHEIIQRYMILRYLRYFQSIIYYYHYYYYSDCAGYFLVSGWSWDAADVWISSCTSEYHFCFFALSVSRHILTVHLHIFLSWNSEPDETNVSPSAVFLSSLPFTA